MLLQLLVFAPVILGKTGHMPERLHRVPTMPLQVNLAVPDSSNPFWQRALREVYKSPEELQAQSDREARAGIFLPKLFRGNSRRAEIALTFDDGPHPERTEELLEVLRQQHVKATFFVVGKMVERYPYLLRAIIAGGHELGNHTFSHVTLTKIPDAMAMTEYQACNDVVWKLGGVHMKVCRPPGGDYDREVIQAAKNLGLTTVLWSDDPGDYAAPSTNVIAKRTLARISKGGIILLHDGIEETIQVLPQIISFARSKGLRFVSASELLRDYSKP